MNFRGGGASANLLLARFQTENKFQTKLKLCRFINAFTLAEVLITLGIIGVVAAMTLPSVINNSRNKQLEAALNKNYSVISQALERYQADTGERITPAEVGTREFKSKIMPYFSVIKDCGYDKCLTSTGEGRNINTYRTYNSGIVTKTYIDDGQFVLKDGSFVMIENTKVVPSEGSGFLDTTSVVFVSVDVNGYNKNPNKWGHDLFTFQLMADGRLLPMGANGTMFEDESTYCAISSSDNANGIGCTYKALTDKDYFKNLPR